MSRVAKLYQEIMVLKTALESYGSNGVREIEFELLFTEYHNMTTLRVVK